MRTIVLLGVTAFIAALLSILVPHLPLSLGIFIPALLCGAVIKENETLQEIRIANADLAVFVSIGISYFLKNVGDQISEDRTVWCERQMNALKVVRPDGENDEMASLIKFARAARELRRGLDRRIKTKDLNDKVAEQAKAINEALTAAKQTHDTQEISDQYDIVDIALFWLLELTYNWKLANIDLTGTPKPPEQSTSPPQQPSKPEHKVG